LSGKEKVPWHQDEKFPWSGKKKKDTDAFVQEGFGHHFQNTGTYLDNVDA
jgi:hypothetical protein